MKDNKNHNKSKNKENLTIIQKFGKDSFKYIASLYHKLLNSKISPFINNSKVSKEDIFKAFCLSSDTDLLQKLRINTNFRIQKKEVLINVDKESLSKDYDKLFNLLTGNVKEHKKFIEEYDVDSNNALIYLNTLAKVDAECNDFVVNRFIDFLVILKSQAISNIQNMSFHYSATI